MNDDVVVYGSSWCGWTVLALRQLDQWGVPYKYVDVDADPAAERLIAGWNNGRSIRPTIQLRDAVFVNPPARQLQAELQSRGLLSQGEAP